MGDSGSGWWFGADRRWRKGQPPRSWRQASDGTWRPPSDGGAWAEDAAEQPARHLTAVPDLPDDDRPRDSSLATRIVAPLSIVVVALCGIVAIAAVAGIARVETGGSGGSGGRTDDLASVEPAPDPPATSGPADPTVTPTGRSSPPARRPADSSSTSTSTSSTSTMTTSTSSSTSSTTEPPSTGTTTEPPPTDAFALCSEVQLAIVGRGNHPWSWYLDRLDANGDGILCN
jgi:hypothetical protein